MNRCENREKCWEKTRERNAEEAFAEYALPIDSLVPEEAAPYFHQVTQPMELRELADYCRIELSPLQFMRLCDMVETLFGSEFARESGLPVNRPRLSLAN